MRRPHKLLAAGMLSTAIGVGGALVATGPVASARPEAGAIRSAATATTTTTTTAQPTAAQVRRAIRSATRSRGLWATINRCGGTDGQQIGIRGQMPALAFPAHLQMVVSLEEYSSTALRYVPVTGSWKLGGQVFDSGSVVQEGISLRFSPNVTLTGHVTFKWFRSGKLLGQVTRATTAGHPNDSGSPRGTSVGTCSLL